CGDSASLVTWQMIFTPLTSVKVGLSAMIQILASIRAPAALARGGRHPHGSDPWNVGPGGKGLRGELRSSSLTDMRKHRSPGAFPNFSGAARPCAKVVWSAAGAAACRRAQRPRTATPAPPHDDPPQ